MQEDGGTHPLTARTRGGLIYALAVMIIVIDQVTKAWAVASLAPGQTRPVIDGVLHWTLYRNPGSAFGFLAQAPALFTILAAAIAIGIIVVSRRPQLAPMAVAMGFLLGGAVGNLIDRLVRPPGFGTGHVVDFIDLRVWPVFNVADMAITSGAALVVLASWIAERRARAAGAAS